jgi:hypothetical protein
MFYKDIEFSAHEEYVEFKEDYPIPAKQNIPEWYKKLEHSIDNLTIKGCMPFLDSLTAGYLLKMPQDFHIKHNVKNKSGDPDSFQSFALTRISTLVAQKKINLNIDVNVHPTLQVEGAPFI